MRKLATANDHNQACVMAMLTTGGSVQVEQLLFTILEGILLSREPYLKSLRSGKSRSQTLSPQGAISLRQCSTR